MKNWRFICVCKKIGVFCKRVKYLCANEENKRSDEDINSDSLL